MIKYKIKSLIYITIIRIVVITSQLINKAYTYNERHMSLTETPKLFVIGVMHTWE